MAILQNAKFTVEIEIIDGRLKITGEHSGFSEIEMLGLCKIIESKILDRYNSSHIEMVGKKFPSQ